MQYFTIPNACPSFLHAQVGQAHSVGNRCGRTSEYGSVKWSREEPKNVVEGIGYVIIKPMHFRSRCLLHLFGLSCNCERRVLQRKICHILMYRGRQSPGICGSYFRTLIQNVLRVQSKVLPYLLDIFFNQMSFRNSWPIFSICFRSEEHVASS